MGTSRWFSSDTEDNQFIKVGLISAVEAVGASRTLQCQKAALVRDLHILMTLRCSQSDGKIGPLARLFFAIEV